MCLESGLARAKNSINVAIKNMADFVLSVSGFAVIGFGLMFGVSHSGLFGTTEFFVDLSENSWLAAFFVFQAVFCGTAATIDSGAVAERTRFGTYLFMSFIVSTIVYPISGHWIWGSLYHGESSGWLESMGFIDFAGSTVVHSVGGWVALAGVIVIGPRLGKFDENGNPRKIHASSLPLAYLGTFILFFGWFGFNCGSTLEASPDIAGIAVNTVIAACFGGLSASALSWLRSPARRPEAETIANGVLAGLVGITAGCAVVGTYGAILIGLVAGAVVYYGTCFVEQVLKLDDVCGAIPVHGLAGAWGTIATGIFITNPNLAGTGLTRWGLIGVQAIGVAAVFAWAFGVTFALLSIMKWITPIRVSAEDEHQGLNVAEHGATSSLLDLAHAMQRATTSDAYDDSLKVVVDHGTEVGDLGACFNRMIDAVGSEQRKAHQALAELEAQRRKTNEMLKRYYEHVEQNVGAIGEKANQIESTLTETAGRADKMAEAVRGVLDRMETLVETFKSVEQMATTVDDIARNTNLLALNASIEAARAGEAGKGFAVVAGEVKRLAHESSTSSVEIQESVGATVSEHRLAANLMSGLMEQASGLVGEMRKAVSGIKDVTSRVAGSCDELRKVFAQAEIA